MRRLTGIGVSPGIAVGRAILYGQKTRSLRYHVPPARILNELQRLADARNRSRCQLEEIRRQFAGASGQSHAYLFEAQLLMLDDPMLIERAASLIRERTMNAAWALQTAYEELAAAFDEAVHDAYLRERKGDVADVVGRLRMNLDGEDPGPLQLIQDLEGPVVLVADDVTPSLVAELQKAGVAAFVADAGSRTHHAAIVARSLGLPAVVGLGDVSGQIPPGAAVVVDGGAGVVEVDPDAADIDRVAERRRLFAERQRSLDEYRTLPAVTLDGQPIALDANIEFPGEAAVARANGASGIGLYRSEFLLVGRDASEVTEAVQYDVYRGLLQAMAPASVTIRTFDLGDSRTASRAGDTMRGRVAIEMGRRGLTREALLRTQVRALLRAAPHGALRVMFPFVAGVEEWRVVRSLLAEERAALLALGGPAPTIPVGVMIEVPSAALTADLLAPETDFLSLGTNDLVQYALALDRAGAAGRSLSASLHPAVLRLIRQVARAAARNARPLSLCGEMAADPWILALLIGLGVSSFSMTPAAISLAKRTVRSVRTDELRRLAARALRLPTAAEVSRRLTDELSGLRF
jgi:phosphotransferase system enzyme I (PtsI)